MADNEYEYHNSEHSHAHDYLLPGLEKILKGLNGRRLIDLGCGNGAIANALSDRYDVLGVDSSESGVSIARAQASSAQFECKSLYDQSLCEYEPGDIVISLEVIEHLFDPRDFLAKAFELTRPGGTIILSTPYHGYLKNVALAISGKMDQHFTVLWDGGHIKFWSRRTLSYVVEEAGFTDCTFFFAGRFWPLWKSMFAVAKRPLDN